MPLHTDIAALSDHLRVYRREILAARQVILLDRSTDGYAAMMRAESAAWTKFSKAAGYHLALDEVGDLLTLCHAALREIAQMEPGAMGTETDAPAVAAVIDSALANDGLEDLRNTVETVAHDLCTGFYAMRPAHLRAAE